MPSCYFRVPCYIMGTCSCTARGLKGEIVLVAYQGPVMAADEVKTRAGSHTEFAKPEDAVTLEKRRHLFHMARRFLVERRLEQVSCRFDVLAIESPPGQRPVVRLHKGAFTGYNYS